MSQVFAQWSGWLTDQLYVERGTPYDPDAPEVAEAMRRHPKAFSERTPSQVEVEQMTANPGERRRGIRGNP